MRLMVGFGSRKFPTAFMDAARNNGFRSAFTEPTLSSCSRSSEGPIVSNQHLSTEVPVLRRTVRFLIKQLEP
jgi:hypothetical protein